MELYKLVEPIGWVSMCSLYINVILAFYFITGPRNKFKVVYKDGIKKQLLSQWVSYN